MSGEAYAVYAVLVISCIVYQTPPIPGVPYEHGRGRFASDDGRILPGLYAVGWARRGPSGTIGTNKPDGARIGEMVLDDIGRGAGKAGRSGLDALRSEEHTAELQSLMRTADAVFRLK